MPFDDVTLDQRRVTRRGGVGNAESTPPLGAFGVIDRRCVEAIVRQVPDPAGATASTGVSPHVDTHTLQRILD